MDLLSRSILTSDNSLVNYLGHITCLRHSSIRNLLNIGKSETDVFGVFAQLIEGAENDIIDARCKTEAKRESMKSGQKKYYSGKKKKHTLKTELQITGKGKIVHISNPHPGRDHDMTVRDQGPPLPPNAQAYVDGGYQGLHKDHGNTEYPYKKSKHHSLTKEEKQYNRALASFRVRVEHKIRELKVFRFLKEQNRNRRKEYGIAVQIIAGIVNIKAGF